MVVNGEEEEKVDLCKNCAPGGTGLLGTLEPNELAKLSVTGKKCEFCGKGAYSGQVAAGGGAIYWCFDCGLEFGRILGELTVSERPELMQRGKAATSFMSFLSDPELRAWSEVSGRNGVQILKERRRQDGRDKGS
jgi:hypothetical protein